MSGTSMSGGSGSLAPVSEALPTLARDKGNFFTKAAGEGDVYGEVIRPLPDGSKWRRWDPHRSKLAAALETGELTPPFAELLAAAPVLYLGAASGTTVSHVADLAAPRAVFAVEVASRSFQDLLVKLRPWPNVFPVHADARSPEAYASLVGKAACIIQDVAQKDQVKILAGNARALLPRGAPCLLFMKARSEDSAAHPDRVFSETRGALRTLGFEPLEERALEPFDRDHRAFLVRWHG